MKKSLMAGGMTRRNFVKRAVGTAVTSAVGGSLISSAQAELPSSDSKPTAEVLAGSQGPMGVERVARLTPVGYTTSAPATGAGKWLQVDLGRTTEIDSVKLFPTLDWGKGSVGFPSRFRILVSSDPTFAESSTIARFLDSDYPNPGDVVSSFPGSRKLARYVRLSVKETRNGQISLSKFEVWSNGRDVAEGCSVTDSSEGLLGRTLLTRKPRGQGEGVQTNNPANVIPSKNWHPVRDKVEIPRGGVTLHGGVFQKAMENNAAYLLSSFSVDELVRPFRQRAGKPIPVGLKPPIDFWDTELPGSNAGRFLMGAGNQVRWTNNPELKQRMNAVVDNIEECREPNGYLMGYPEQAIFDNERGGYTRSWVTHGLIEAGLAGNPKAFPLLRGFYDWFNQCRYLPELMRRGGQGVQGMIASTRVYFTPVGKPDDLHTVQQFYQENYWMDQLAGRRPEAIWQYPYDHPHNYLITSLEPYLDQYRATGSPRYLQAALGGWELYHNDWEHIGGSIAICEGDTYPPKSNYLHQHTGELCGSVFWIKYNQRFHQLYPNDERYVNEIEKSIYNVGLANQIGGESIRYHANLDGHKDAGTSHNSCCEGQGTRLFGSLPEYIYSIAPDGIYINLFAASTISWKHRGSNMSVRMDTEFPYRPDVQLEIATDRTVQAALHLRIPRWATGEMLIEVNGTPSGHGQPGSYFVMDRTWNSGDRVTFSLPMAPQWVPYAGADQTLNGQRTALLVGPVLMALVGDAQSVDMPLNDLKRSLVPKADQPLHFSIRDHENLKYMPYWQVAEEQFTCFPVIGKSSLAMWGALTDNLALRSKGATAQSDSEYAREPGGTEKVIDGIVSSSWDGSHRWHSSLLTPHPHWIQVTLPKPAMIGWVVIRFADPAGHPVSFQGIARVNGKDKVLFDVVDYSVSGFYTKKIDPVTTDSFRLIIRQSANPAYPNAAQVSNIELYPPRSSDQHDKPSDA